MPLHDRGRYTTLLQGFCPLCFRGRIGESNGERFQTDDPRVDQVQLFHSKKLNGIPPLDFKSMGTICVDPDMCNVNCLVCGKAVFRGGSGAYRLFKHMIQPDHEERAPKAMKAFDEIGNAVRFREALKSHDAVLVETWDTPIHRECAYQAQCKCLLPLACTVCNKHRKREGFQWGRPAESKHADGNTCGSMSLETEADVSLLPDGQAAQGAAGGAGSSWAAAKSKGAVFTMQLPTLKEDKDWSLCAPLLSKPKPVNKKAIPLPPGARTLDQWVAYPRSAFNAVLESSCAGFNFKEHSRAFDASRHGYVATKDGVYYRFPDGRFIKTHSGVSTITEDGLLVPSGSDVVMRDP